MISVGLAIFLMGSFGCERLVPFVAASSDAASSDAASSDALSSDARSPEGAQAPSSCAEIQARDPSAHNGEYPITVNGQSVQVYCDMSGGGWTRAARFDVSATVCPGEWASAFAKLTKVCKNPTRDGEAGGSALASFNSPLKSYSEVRGFVRAYQFGSMDAFNTDSEIIDGLYVDGISITCGSPRRHIWTLAAGLMAGSSSGSCPCVATARQPPKFVDERYHCDTANFKSQPVYYWLDDPLWAGGADAACKTLGAPAWFEAKLDPSTDQPIDVRLLQDQSDTDENIGVVEMELYVR